MIVASMETEGRLIKTQTHIIYIWHGHEGENARDEEAREK